MKVKIFTDGSARGNPEGPGGYGAIIQFVDSRQRLHEREFSGGFKQTTNNRMELLAAIIGLEALTKPCEVNLISDSKYLTEAFNQGWIWNWQLKGWKTSTNKPVKNIDLWKRLLTAAKPHKVNFVWIKGHEGNEGNERCDKLATAAADGEEETLAEDVGYMELHSKEFIHENIP
ncbi:MAG: ribonuclease HI [Lachnospiraceae bacterium]|nr:ribonuclease HI [Lachnospiraceae bacterium]